MILIGLTGNIATGKSTVMALLHERGAVTLDADALVHELMEPGTDVVEAIAERFGTGVLDEIGAVDRKRLGAIVFNDPQALRDLEAIVHPAVGERIVAEVEYWRAQPNSPPALVVEAVKLVESGRHEMCDVLWLVVADRAVQRRRLLERRGLRPEDVEARLSAQPPSDKKRDLADVIIENNRSLEALEQQVDCAWRSLLANTSNA